jgi:hypothetical protein
MKEQAMNRKMVWVLVGTLLAAGGVSVGLAGPVTIVSDPIEIQAGDLVQPKAVTPGVYTIGHYAGGGIFFYDVWDSTGTVHKGTIATFCLERAEAVSLGQRPVGSVGPDATNGGWIWDGTQYRKAVPGESDPMNAETAWLYGQFLAFIAGQPAFTGMSVAPDFQGTVGLDDDQKAASQRAWALALQYAIWFFEDEVFLGQDGILYTRALDPIYQIPAEAGWNDWAKEFITLAQGKSDSSIQVVNPYKVKNDGSIQPLQSFPNQRQEVPEPGTLALVGLGLLAAGRLRRQM